ncbi:MULTISPECIES: shikimate 5-dehydrogenase [Thermotoga]|jgi:shikimate dehydrogenase|uniref:Shikimate dehydrogenase n=5 Tax=Thermotoga TaxID=2335 RepID=AROE_THENN|nr:MULTISPECIES: shikimate 5-dehydrogenase [Thermotoga]A5IK72.1 RecName: Full=Shikimate dehydrogenase [Thermotoga petrophila RKU-1]B1L9E4.1 RecName: Full=Shikimate dehydrogenase [Thermotoga sp. RQ2]B9KBV5.1 RecName: Full=Shikimate dehydrogenase [Thermotoga neapolitana DSM 4359]KUK22567.1 MAG: Shikimate dehydrogenase [Thermotoga petrophila]KUK33282.1 MAG: Shikimate dehydrogenase [Thermotoga sp. 47_83]MDK2893461.1 shikimate dehydrogenase [Thermotoga sp.]ABQ46595.1 shikimate dehydrogenase [Ther
MKFCIIGYPVSHSISPRLYNEYFKRAGMNHSYGMEEIPPESFDTEIRRILEEYDGFNATIPHKERVMRYVEPSEDAQRIKAVNCVFRGKGYNTDWVGVVKSLEGVEVKEPVVVVGAGGAARAVIYALLQMGVKDIWVVNRTIERAKALDFPVKIFSLDQLDEVVKKAKSLFNTTSVGMKGEKLTVSEASLKGLYLVYDVVYFETPLVSDAKRLGVEHVVKGNLMFYYQAMENLKIWGIYDERSFKEVFEEVLR